MSNSSKSHSMVSDTSCVRDLKERRRQGQVRERTSCAGRGERVRPTFGGACWERHRVAVRIWSAGEELVRGLARRIWRSTQPGESAIWRRSNRDIPPAKTSSVCSRMGNRLVSLTRSLTCDPRRLAAFTRLIRKSISHHKCNSPCNTVEPLLPNMTGDQLIQARPDSPAGGEFRLTVGSPEPRR